MFLNILQCIYYTVKWNASEHTTFLCVEQIVDLTCQACSKGDIIF